jgi:transcriptional regulator with XRE-family HTH domain
MANENLKNALRSAGLTPDEFAQVIRVDPKSVQRWVAGTTVPYPRHRVAISRALGLSEHQLWPDQINAQVSEVGAGLERSDGRCDVLGTWGHANDPAAPDLVSFVTGTDGPIDVLDPYPGIDIPEGLADALAAQAAVGRQVRILSGEPLPVFAQLDGCDGIEILDSEIDLACWFIQGGDRMLLNIDLQDDPAVFAPPLIELTGTVEGGLFNRLEDKFDELWREAEDRSAYDKRPRDTVGADDHVKEAPPDGSTRPDGSPPSNRPQAPQSSSRRGQSVPEEQRRGPRRPT